MTRSTERTIALIATAAAGVLLAACGWDWQRFEPVVVADGFDSQDANDSDSAVDALTLDAADAASDSAIADVLSVDAGLCGTSGSACCSDAGTAACNAGLVCSAGLCTACNGGQTVCAGVCVDLATDATHCGSCDQPCVSGAICRAARCGLAPVNDTRTGAVAFDLSMPTDSSVVDTSFAGNDTAGACGCTTGPDVFYTFTLTQREFVYADTIGSSFNTSLFLQDATGANVLDAHISGGTTCNDDGGPGCSIGSQSMIVAKLDEGTYYLVVSGCGSGTARVHFGHLPAGGGNVIALSAAPGSTQLYSDSVSGTGTLTSACCSDGPEDAYWWITCPDFAGTTLEASTCGAATFNTELDQRSTTRNPVSVCNDDNCGMQSLLVTTIPPGAGLHALYVDSCLASAGDYTLAVTLGPCTTGSLCSARCTDLQNDPTHCGSCTHFCDNSIPNAAASCVAGSCGFTCAAGFADCDLNPANGCEARLDSPSTCGSCGTACNATNGTPACTAGVCSITCNPGFANCDGLLSNGCEVNTQTDLNNCGMCTHRCFGMRTCVAGSCV